LAADAGTFRPFEEERRGVPLHRRNDLLHVEIAASRPTGGARVLRVITNVNPEKPRVWQVAEANFESLARQLAEAAGLMRIAEESSFAGAPRDPSEKFGFRPAGRTAYDMFMLRFHDYMKENAEFQRSCPKVQMEFPPFATWLVFTDCVAHAVLAGKYDIEQAFLIPPDAVVAPEHAPLRILENIAGCSLVG
jgi:3-deoxy-D-manno-oct-2-ulosonic acid (Kdo) hydroxylase